MAGKKKKDEDGFVTLRVEFWKRVIVYSEGFVNLKLPKANRRRVIPAWHKESQIAKVLDKSNCIEWVQKQPCRCEHLLIDLEQVPDSDQAYRCHFNRKTKEFELIPGEGAASRVVEVTNDNN